MKIDAVVIGFHRILSFPRKRESSNDFVVPRLREDSVWTPASAGVTGFLTFYETDKST